MKRHQGRRKSPSKKLRGLDSGKVRAPPSEASLEDSESDSERSIIHDEEDAVLLGEGSLYDRLLSTLESTNKRVVKDGARTTTMTMMDKKAINRCTNVEREHEEDELSLENDDLEDIPEVESIVEMEKDDDNAVNESNSNFLAHLGHTLTQAEVNELVNKKWKFKWETSDLDAPKSKWLGTGDTIFKDPNHATNNQGLLQSLYSCWLRKTARNGGFNSSRIGRFFSLCNSYRDVLHCSKKPFYLKGEEDSSTMDAYILHILNHVLRTRNLVIKNETKLAKHKSSGNEELLYEDTARDQGFTRPKVLILLPFRSCALRLVKRLIEISPFNNVKQNDWFFHDCGIEESDENEKRASTKPKDYQLLFGGNSDDDFMFGIKITKKCIKLLSKDYDTSDVIVASPLCLSFKINEAKEDKAKDVDYLSSIEVLVIDHADIMTMQNWSYLSLVVEKLNQKPTKKCADIMRIRQWYLDGYAKFYRQTIFLGYFINSDMNAMFHNHCLNYEGKVKSVSEYKGILAKILLQVRQVYERFAAPSIVDADDARFAYFTTKLYPKIKNSVEGGIMLFVSSYLDFVRLRNFLHNEKSSFCFVSGYTEKKDIPRARLWFYEGKKKILLCDERFHFFNRYKIKGVKSIVMYSLPERKEFYPEFLNMLTESSNMACTIIFSQFDKMQLERIVGTPYAKKMLSSNKDMFVFC